MTNVHNEESFAGPLDTVDDLGFGGQGGTIPSRLMADLEVRPARPDEAKELSELALRSKGYWGYDAAFLGACREELTVGPADIGSRRVTVAADVTDRPIGFYTLDGEPPEGTLGMLFVDPDRIGSGVGRLLWEHVTGRATALGFRSFRIEADPGAASFYERMGRPPSGRCRRSPFQAGASRCSSSTFRSPDRRHWPRMAAATRSGCC